MNDLRIYYRFDAIGLDYSSEKDVKKYSEELTSFDNLSNQFYNLKVAFDTASKERADIAINIFPDICGVTELDVYHRIHRKLFSKEIKKQCFYLYMIKYEPSEDTDAMYEYESKDIEEVKNIFNDLLTKHKAPELIMWKRVL